MPHADPEARRAYDRDYRRRNQEAQRAYKRAYVERNPETRAASVAKSNASEKTKASKASYRERNREALRAAGRAYARSNRAAMNSRYAKYRAAKMKATPSWADADSIAAVYAEARAITTATGIPHHVDHIYPLVSHEVCGLHVHQNLRVVTAKENQRKGNRVTN